MHFGSSARRTTEFAATLLVYWLAGGPPAIAAFAYLFLLFRDRDRLQSEEYQVTMRQLDLMEQKGSLQAIAMRDVPIIEPPPRPAILPKPSEPEGPA